QFNVGANVAVGDINHDGYADIVTGATVGNPDVRVFSGKDIARGAFSPDGASLMTQFFPYAVQFNVGANVAVGDVNGDGYADLVTGATAGNPDVHVYSGKDITTGVFRPDGASLLAQFFPYAIQFNVGVFVAVGDVNGDGYGDVITGSSVGNPEVRVYSGKAIATGGFDGANPDRSLLTQFFAFEVGTNTGVTVGATDPNGDGKLDIVTGRTAGQASYRVVSGLSTGTHPPAFYEADVSGLSAPV